VTLFGNRFFAREWNGDLYRVYVDAGYLTFVRVAGRDALRGLLALVPVFDEMLVTRWDDRARRALREKLAADDHRNVRALLARDPRSFRLAARQVASAVIDPPDLASDRPHCGSLKIDAAGRRHVFLFEEVPEMATAIRLLKESLGSLLVNRAVWSARRKRFISEVAASMSARPLVTMRR